MRTSPWLSEPGIRAIRARHSVAAVALTGGRGWTALIRTGGAPRTSSTASGCAAPGCAGIGTSVIGSRDSSALPPAPSSG